MPIKLGLILSLSHDENRMARRLVSQPVQCCSFNADLIFGFSCFNIWILELGLFLFLSHDWSGMAVF